MSTWGWLVALFTCGWKRWSSAIWETFVIAFVSLIPLIGAAFREALPSTGPSVGSSVMTAFLGGQLLFYAMGFISSIVWECQKDRKHKFPLRGFLVLFSIAGIAICSAVIGFDPKLEHTKRDLLAWLSASVFMASAFFYALVRLVQEIDGSEFKQTLQTEARDLSKELADLKGGQE